MVPGNRAHRRTRAVNSRVMAWTGALRLQDQACSDLAGGTGVHFHHVSRTE